MKALALEKEKLLIEDHKTEMEKLSQRSRAEVEKMRTQYYDDLRTKSDEYESKLTDMRIK